MSTYCCPTTTSILIVGLAGPGSASIALLMRLTKIWYSALTSATINARRDQMREELAERIGRLRTDVDRRLAALPSR